MLRGQCAVEYTDLKPKQASVGVCRPAVDPPSTRRLPTVDPRYAHRLPTAGPQEAR